jgi:transposase-like protein
MGLFNKKPKCLHCGSKKIFREEKGFHSKLDPRDRWVFMVDGAFALMAEAIQSALIPSLKNKQMQWHCEKCGKTFEIGAEE